MREINDKFPPMVSSNKLNNKGFYTWVSEAYELSQSYDIVLPDGVVGLTTFCYLLSGVCIQELISQSMFHCADLLGIFVFKKPFV